MRRSIVISAVMVVCVLILLLFGFDSQSADVAASPGPAVLLVEDDTGSFLLQVKQGAQQAATQAGCILSQETLQDESLAETALRWGQRKASAALLLMDDAELREKAAEAFVSAGVPVVSIRDGGTRKGYAAMDEQQAGVLLAKAAQMYARVYLIGDSPQRLEGALSVLSRDQVEIGSLPAQGENACVIALTGEETRRLAALRQSGVLTASLIGMDPGEDRVQLMSSGAVDALAMETPYALGYMAMNMALSGESKACLLPYQLVVPSEMYEAKNVKLMFPLLR